MRYAVISDIHANLEALTAFLDYLKVNPVDHIIHCGDIVGYGASPHECIEKVRAIPNFRAVLGNHDAVAAGKIKPEGFNQEALKAMEINRALLKPEDVEYLKKLPEQISSDDIFFVHGSPRYRITEYLFLMDKFKENIRLFNESVCFVGHTHHPLVYQYEMGSGNDTCMNVEEDMELFTLSPMKKYIVNVGAVGQPRDNKASLCSAFFDTKSRTLTFKRIAYDVKAAQQKMRALNMPESLVTRLAIGY